MTAKGSSGRREGDPIARASRLFNVIDLPAEGMPVRFAVALPGQALLQIPRVPDEAMPYAGRMASGRGLDPESCRKSCLGEAAELFSCCEWGGETLVAATADEIGPCAILPDALNGFNLDQSLQRAAWNRQHGSFDWRPAACPSTRKIDWLAVEDAFGGKPAYIPADFAFIGRREPGDRRAVVIGDSNGCAAGPDAEAAKFAAILELVERDATSRWWYGRRLRRTIDPSTVSGSETLTGWLSARARKTRLFDITTDIGIPVIAAASAEPDGCDIAVGFAARLDGNAAAVAAVTEMLQMEVSLATARMMGEAAGTWWLWRNEVSMATPPLSAAAATLPSPSLLRGGVRGGGSSTHDDLSGAPPNLTHHAAGLAVALDALARTGIHLWFADMTRPEIGVPVFRAISAALCHYKPRFGKPRLLAPDEHDLARAKSPPDMRPLLLI